MQTAAQLASKATNHANSAAMMPAGGSEKSPPKRMSEKWVMALFNRLEAIYPGRWLSQFSAKGQMQLATAEWSMALGDVNGDQVSAGLAYCRDNEEWPPTIAKFRKACLGQLAEKDITQGANGQAYQVFPKGLPAPKADKSAAAKALAEARGKLSANQKPDVKADGYIDAGDVRCYGILKATADWDKKPFDGLYTRKDLELLRDLPRFQRA